jgi:hypothetical protein
LEFYHDKGGITSGKEAFKASIKNNICGGPNKVKRELIPNSMKVYPLYNNNVLYAFIQEGEHDFAEFYKENGTKEAVQNLPFSGFWTEKTGK